MTECPDCGRPVWDGGHPLNPRECSGDTFSRELCDTHAEVRRLKSRLALAMAVVEAAEPLRYQASNHTRSDTGSLDYALTEAIEDFDSALAELRKAEGKDSA